LFTPVHTPLYIFIYVFMYLCIHFSTDRAGQLLPRERRDVGGLYLCIYDFFFHSFIDFFSDPVMCRRPAFATWEMRLGRPGCIILSTSLIYSFTPLFLCISCIHVFIYITRLFVLIFNRRPVFAMRAIKLGKPGSHTRALRSTCLRSTRASAVPRGRTATVSLGL